MSKKTNSVKYYTLPGLGDVFTDYSMANKAKKGKDYTKYQYPVALGSSEDALALEAGKWRDYLSSVETSIGDFEAIIYTDGSFNDVGETYASYGLIIFRRNGDVICETAQLKDGEPGEVYRYSFDELVRPLDPSSGYRRSAENAKGKLDKEIIRYKVINEDNPGFVTASRNIAGEMMGALRGFEICFSELLLSKVAIVCDCKSVKERFYLGTEKADCNLAYYFGEYCQTTVNYQRGLQYVEFIDVNSHNLLSVKDKDFMHAVYNDMCDALAKTVCPNHKVNQAENPNLRVALAEYTDKFNIKKSDAVGLKHLDANKLLKVLLTIKEIKPELKCDKERISTKIEREELSEKVYVEDKSNMYNLTSFIKYIEWVKLKDFFSSKKATDFFEFTQNLIKRTCEVYDIVDNSGLCELNKESCFGELANALMKARSVSSDESYQKIVERLVKQCGLSLSSYKYRPKVDDYGETMGVLNNKLSCYVDELNRLLGYDKFDTEFLKTGFHFETSKISTQFFLASTDWGKGADSEEKTEFLFSYLIEPFAKLYQQDGRGNMKGKIYGVRIGRMPGVYNTWKECEGQVKGYAGAIFRGFPYKNEEEKKNALVVARKFVGLDQWETCKEQDSEQSVSDDNVESDLDTEEIPFEPMPQETIEKEDKKFEEDNLNSEQTSESSKKELRIEDFDKELRDKHVTRCGAKYGNEMSEAERRMRDMVCISSVNKNSIYLEVFLYLINNQEKNSLATCFAPYYRVSEYYHALCRFVDYAFNEELRWESMADVDDIRAGHLEREFGRLDGINECNALYIYLLSSYLTEADRQELINDVKDEYDSILIANDSFRNARFQFRQDLLRRSVIISDLRSDAKNFSKEASISLREWINKGGHSLIDLYRELMTNPVYKKELERLFTFSENRDFEDGNDLLNEEEKELSNIIEETNELRNLLESKISGQDTAIEQVVDAYFKGEVNASSNKNRKGPRNVMLFAGPPGVGKTYLSENFAEYVVDKENYLRLDMSAYAHHNSFNELVGFAKTWKDSNEGVLTSFARKHPNAVILFDEIEKAHLTVIHLFLQILDRGSLRDLYSDEEVSFKNITVIFTTNAGKQLYEDAENKDLSNISGKVIIDALQNDVNPETKAPFFPAAITSRLSSYTIVMFNHLQTDAILNVVKGSIAAEIKKNEETFDISISNNEFLAPTMMYKIGGRSDARNATKVFEKFIYSQIFGMMDCIINERDSSEVKKIKNVDFEINLGDAENEVRELYKGITDTAIVCFGVYKDNKEERERKATKLKDNEVDIIYVDNKEEYFNTIKKNNVLFTVINYDADVTEGQNKTLLISERDCVARRIIKELDNPMYNFPIYLLEEYENKYSVREKRGLRMIGVDGFVQVTDNSKWDEALLNAYTMVSFRNNMETLALKHKVLNFDTRTQYTADKVQGLIELYNLRLETAIDAADQDSVLSVEMSPNVTRDDIVVPKFIMDELDSFVDNLKHLKELKLHGLSAPKGVLLYGPPGTGKTSLAKVVATEAGFTFLNKNADELVYAGQKGVHELFRTARKYAPAVLFIDEIDAIAKNRQKYGDSPTLNALLTEMDGFVSSDDKPVFVMAATNSFAELDPAVVRRFNNHLFLNNPNKEYRKLIIKKMMAKMPDFNNLSEKAKETLLDRTEGKSPSQIKDILEWAIRETLRNHYENVTEDVLNEAIEQILYGAADTNVSDEDIEHIAVHEMGHTLLTLATGEIPAYVCVASRSGFLGYMQSKKPDKCHYSKEDYLSEIRIALAGRAAEVVYYKEKGITSGLASDIEKANWYAEKMVCDWGMYGDEIGYSVISEEEYINNAEAKNLVNKILEEQLESAMKYIEDNKNIMDELIKTIIASNNKYMTGKEIETIWKKYKKEERS